MKTLFINRRTFNIGTAAAITALTSFPTFASSKLKVAGIYTQPIQQKWDARLHLALDARDDIEYVFSE